VVLVVCVNSPDVAEVFREFANAPFNFESRFEGSILNAFELERGKEALSDGIVPTLSFIAHTSDHFHLIERANVFIGGIGRSPVGVVDETWGWLAPEVGTMKGGQSELDIVSVAERKAHNSVGKYVDTGGNVNPTGDRPVGSHVDYPNLVRCLAKKSRFSRLGAIRTV